MGNGVGIFGSVSADCDMFIVFIGGVIDGIFRTDGRGGVVYDVDWGMDHGIGIGGGCSEWFVLGGNEDACGP
jgi:hypothetical protein